MSDVPDDDRFWTDQGELMKRAARRLFKRAFIQGAHSGAEEPAARRELRRWTRSKERDERVGYAAAPPDGIDWLRIAAIADEFITDYLDEWWMGLEATTRSALRSAIADARAEGLGVRGVAARIAPWFDRVRAEAIAVTETSRLMGQGAQATYKAIGFGVWEWRTANDDRTCPICAKRAKDSKLQPYPMTTAFVPAHPRCRCWPVPKGRAALPAPAG